MASAASAPAPQQPLTRTRPHTHAHTHTQLHPPRGRAGHLTIHDFLHPERVKLTGVLFSAMFNLSKFQLFEGRDAVTVKQELNMQGITQWDRYAQAEYARLASEEEANAAAQAVAATGGASYGDGMLDGVGSSATASFHLDDDDDEREGPMAMHTLDNLNATVQRR